MPVLSYNDIKNRNDFEKVYTDMVQEMKDKVLAAKKWYRDENEKRILETMKGQPKSLVEEWYIQTVEYIEKRLNQLPAIIRNEAHYSEYKECVWMYNLIDFSTESQLFIFVYERFLSDGQYWLSRIRGHIHTSAIREIFHGMFNHDRLLRIKREITNDSPIVKEILSNLESYTHDELVSKLKELCN